jgi:hypothetical protein
VFAEVGDTGLSPTGEENIRLCLRSVRVC